MTPSNIPLPLSIPTPALILDLERFECNVQNMQRVAATNGIRLRPHGKTLRSTALLKMVLEAGAQGLTVAKLEHAGILGRQGCKDIFIANYVPLDRLKTMVELQQSMESLASGLGSMTAARAISDTFHTVGQVHNVLVKVDVGLHRLGLASDEVPRFVSELITLPGLKFCGIFSHSGQAYRAEPHELPAIGRAEGETMVAVKTAIEQRGVLCPIVSVGSTPTAADNALVPGVTEIRPGLYMVYDRIQVALGVAQPEQCALFVLATIIDVQTDGAFIDAGSQTLSADCGPHGVKRVEGYGGVVNHPHITVANLSEEHGWFRGAGVGELRIGEQVLIVPNHACATINLHKEIVGVRNGVVDRSFSIDARGAIH